MADAVDVAAWSKQERYVIVSYLRLNALCNNCWINGLTSFMTDVDGIYSSIRARDKSWCDLLENMSLT